MSQTFIIIDDHSSVLEGTYQALQKGYPMADVSMTNTVGELETLLETAQPNLLIMDLSLPQKAGTPPRIETGLKLLNHLLTNYRALNIVIQSIRPEAVVHFVERIHHHPAGFTIAEKSLSPDEMLTKVSWALQGLIYIPPEMRIGIEMKEEWLELLNLAFNESLQDSRIAQEMNVSIRTIRHYWTRIQGALDVYPNDGINARIKTYNRAREAGLLE